MNQYFTEFKQANLATPPPPPLVMPLSAPLNILNPVLATVIRVSIDKIWKYGAEEFRGTVHNDPFKAEYWLLNTKRVFVELLSTPEDCLRLDTLSTMVLDDQVNWDFFQNDFKKKYVSQLFIDQKKKEFLELKQGNQNVAEYEHELVQLSKYARNIVSNEEEMCIRFEDGLNDEICMAIATLKLRE
ncbi:uncharacterized protein [Gossypium hirsutum]|uniref:Retrotransposon gag domain-containing protein n=1 Tax=Gossypium hirsutum TaxID=3635 RepID=A0A1U8NFN0_GOSHI|nr:uncharacterized protein LOC107947821 [Gossypium hirsutum]